MCALHSSCRRRLCACAGDGVPDGRVQFGGRIAAARDKIREDKGPAIAVQLTQREIEKLYIYQVAELARRRRARGLRLNYAEAIALITEAILEGARDGRTVAELMDLGRTVLTYDDVMPEVPVLLHMVHV